jgi:hypothetical protein
MCCNRPRTSLASQALSIARNNAAQRLPVRPDPAAVPPPARPAFRYVGATALTLVSPITRKTYRFEHPGARLEVDPRDRSWVAFAPNLVAATD